MSWAIEEMLNIVWCLAAVGADVEANILTDSVLVGAEESTMSGWFSFSISLLTIGWFVLQYITSNNRVVCPSVYNF